MIGATRDLLQADWPDAAELAVRTDLEAAGYDAVALWWYDAETDTFDLRNAARADSLADSGHLTQFSELAWRFYQHIRRVQKTVFDTLVER